MSKLIIRHGERVTEHSIADHPLVVGRDPQCDLFFADKKLSRRHARFERDGESVRLIDLGSRNGCWVNEERVDNVVLSPDDAVRLGALAITVELDEARAGPEPGEDQESTVVLEPEPSADDSRTIVLPRSELPDDPETPLDTGTVVLRPTETMLPVGETAVEETEAGYEDPTLRKADTPESTLMLDASAAPVSADTGTVIFRGGVQPPADATRVAAPAPAREGDVSQPGSSIVPDDATELGDEPWTVDQSPSVTPKSTARYVALVAAVAALAFVVLALPLVRTLGSALETESTLRGRALVELLSVSNEAALRENREDAISVDRIAAEPGVLAAYVLDPMGQVLVPEEMASESITPLFESLGIQGEVKDIRAFREMRANDGSVVYAVPVRSSGRRLGLAVLHYRPGGAVSGWTATMLLFGSLLLLMGVGAAVLLARRWTLLPVQELRDDVEALRQGLIADIAEDRPYSDLATIARNFNELLRGGGHPGEQSSTFKPMMDPTLVPDERDRAEG